MKNVPALSITALLLAATAFAADPSATQPTLQKPPLTYNAVSDTKYYPKPELPKLGPAGSTLLDPTFHCPILRVTDEKTAQGISCMTPAGAESNCWNADSTLFVIEMNGARNIPFRFDPKTTTATRIKDLDYLPDMQGMVQFSRHNPNLCYGSDGQSGKVYQFDFSTNKSTEILDTAKIVPEAGHMGALTISDNDILSLVCGGAQQNASPYLITYNLKTADHHLWNTKDGTVDGKPIAGAPHFTQHAGEIDRSGRYIWSGGPGVSGPIIWDTQTNDIYPMAVGSGGHRATGFGDMVNDVHKWVYRTLDKAGIDKPIDLMEHPAGEAYFQYDSHPSWNNARPDMKVPVVLATYHHEEAGDPKCAYGDEIIAIATDGSKKIWRFAHTRTTVHSPNKEAARAAHDPAADPYNFWDTPRGNISQDGRFFVFTSNWQDTLGKDPHNRFREDVFLVKLEQQVP